MSNQFDTHAWALSLSLSLGPRHLEVAVKNFHQKWRRSEKRTFLKIFFSFCNSFRQFTVKFPSVGSVLRAMLLFWWKWRIDRGTELQRKSRGREISPTLAKLTVGSLKNATLEKISSSPCFVFSQLRHFNKKLLTATFKRRGASKRECASVSAKLIWHFIWFSRSSYTEKSNNDKVGENSPSIKKTSGWNQLIFRLFKFPSFLSASPFWWFFLTATSKWRGAREIDCLFIITGT